MATDAGDAETGQGGSDGGWIRAVSLERAFANAGCGAHLAVFLARRETPRQPEDPRARRRADFAMGRAAAARGLAAIGVPEQAIGRGARREPVWPEGVAGSISHTSALAVAVVCRTGDGSAATVGIDAERIGAVARADHETLFTSEERAFLARGPALGREFAATCLFCAKEALYKAQFPLTGAFVDLPEVSLAPADAAAAAAGTWRLRHGPAVLERFRFALFHRRIGDHVIAGCAAHAAAK